MSTTRSTARDRADRGAEARGAPERRLAPGVHGGGAQDAGYLPQPSETSPCALHRPRRRPRGQARKRRTSVLGYSHEEPVARTRIVVPVSRHAVDSVNLKNPRLGIYDQVSQLVAEHGVRKGRIRLSLAPGERNAGLTVNEYETLLMRHDLPEVLRDPLRFMAEKAGHMFGNPRAIPAKTLDYAKYDLVRVFNKLLDAVGLHESMVETVLARAIAMPASRFLRMKRSVSLFVSDRHGRSRDDRRGHLPESHPGPVAPRQPPGACARRHAHAVCIDTGSRLRAQGARAQANLRLSNQGSCLSLEP